MNETPKTIVEWLKTVIPEPTVEKQLIKLENELQELKSATDRDNLEEEIADMVIILMGLSQIVGFRLQQRINQKMRINRNRKWRQVSDGTHQHV